MRYYFLADSHLGSHHISDSDKHQQHLIAWLIDKQKRILNEGGDEPGGIILLGDIFDFWFEFAYSIPPGFEALLDTLREITASGVRIDFFCGNHDQWTWGYLADYCGMHIHQKAEVMTLGGRKFFLAHGHGLGEKRLAARLINCIFESCVCKWLFRYAVIPKYGLQFGYNWSAKNRAKHALEYSEYDNINYYDPQGSDLIDYQVEWSKNFITQHSDIDYIVMGHLHKEVNLQLSGKTQLLIVDEFYERFGYGIYDGKYLWAGNYEMEEKNPKE